MDASLLNARSSAFTAVAKVNRLERALKERNGLEAERRRAESKLKVLETQRDVDIQTLHDLQNEITALKLQASCARAATEEHQEPSQPLKQPTSAPKPEEKDSASGVWQRTKAFEDRIREQKPVSSPKVGREERRDIR